MPEDRETSGNVGEAAGTSTNAPVKPSSEYVTVEDFKKFQSVKDREVAEAKRAAEEFRRKSEELEKRLEEMIDDPVKRAEYQNERTKAQLEYYKQREEMEKQRRWFVENYNIPLSELENAEDPAEITLLALEWQKKQAEAAKAASVARAREEELRNIEESGGDAVSKIPGTPPERQRISAEEIEKEIQSLREVARKGGSAGERARIQILKLERERQVSSRPFKAKV